MTTVPPIVSPTTAAAGYGPAHDAADHAADVATADRTATRVRERERRRARSAPARAGARHRARPAAPPPRALPERAELEANWPSCASSKREAAEVRGRRDTVLADERRLDDETRSLGANADEVNTRLYYCCGAP